MAADCFAIFAPYVDSIPCTCVGEYPLIAGLQLCTHTLAPKVPLLSGTSFKKYTDVTIGCLGLG